jgi:DNA polymerase
VPRAFLSLAARVACHRDPRRWPALYRLLWRVAGGELHLLGESGDPDALAVERLAADVRHDLHRIHALARFRPVETEAGTRYVAWHRPDHRTLALAAPFFARRFPSHSWSLLTPDASAHADGGRLRLGPGVPRDTARGGDDVEALWRAFYRSTYEPSRANERLLRAQLPERYWAELPEAQEIRRLLRVAVRPRPASPTRGAAARR